MPLDFLAQCPYLIYVFEQSIQIAASLWKGKKRPATEYNSRIIHATKEF